MDFKHVDFKYVYEPAEDSFLLMDALDQELAYMNEVIRPKIVLEI